jgi:hypothetical protein
MTRARRYGTSVSAIVLWLLILPSASASERQSGNRTFADYFDNESKNGVLAEVAYEAPMSSSSDGTHAVSSESGDAISIQTSAAEPVNENPPDPDPVWIVSYNPCGRIATSYDVPNSLVPNGPGICTPLRPDNNSPNGRGRPGGGGPSVGALVNAARDRAVALAAVPQIRIAPPREGVTGLTSYFWLAQAPQPISATASAGPVTVVAQAHPAEYVWNFGDGSDHVGDGPGRPWTRQHSGGIGHMYETKAVYDVTIDVVWEARWQLNGGPWQPLGYFTTSDEREYPVQEVITVLVPAD